MKDDDIYKLANHQLKQKTKWKVETSNAEGTGDYKTTYSAGQTELYVMTPNKESVDKIRNEINEYLEKDKK